MMTVGLLFCVMATCFPETVMRLYTDKPAIQAVGVEYLRIAGFSYPLMVFSMGMAALLLCTDRVRLPLYGSLTGVVATIAAVQYRNFVDILEAAAGQETPEAASLILLLDHITDVRNMGAIARTAECTGATALVVPDHGSAALNDDAIKTSSGALLRLPVCREQNLKTVVNLAKQYGYQVVAATEKGAVHYRSVDFRRPTLLIMGNEETGIAPDLLRLSDLRAKLPMVGEVASLNVSVAAGVLMYEALEQRGLAD